MITDRFTAKILGLLLISFSLFIDVSFVMLSRPETKQNPFFFFIVLVPSLPLLAFGAWLLRRASKLSE